MPYAKLTDGDIRTGDYPLTLADVRRREPGRIFPVSPSEASLNAIGYVTVLLEPEPEFDPREKQLLANPPHAIEGLWYQGWSLVNLRPVDRFTNLVQSKRRAAASIDQAAERVRGRFITMGPGQAMSYLTKQREALAVQEAIKAGAALPSAPILEALIGTEVKADGSLCANLSDVAEVVLQEAASWSAIEAQIDLVRRGVKLAVSSANSFADIDSLEAAAIASLSAIEELAP